MPIYEYLCEQCGHELDALQKINEPRLTDCPECAAPALKKLVSAPSFRLKGSGWYETDFKQDKRRNLADSDDGGKKDGGKKDDGAKADGKKDGSAAKTDAKSTAGEGKAAASAKSKKDAGDKAASA